MPAEDIEYNQRMNNQVCFMSRDRKIKPRHIPMTLEELSLKPLLDGSPDGIVIFDEDNIIRSFSKSAEKIFGYEASEVIGTPISILIPEDVLRQGELERLQALVEKNGCLDRQCVTRLHKNGARIKLELTRTPVYDEEGHMVGQISLFRDVTRSAELEMEIRLAEKLAAVNKLVSGLAHELGTPLNIIHGHAELILGDLSLEHPHADSLAVILSSCHRMTALMKSLLQSVSQKEVERNSMDINKLLEELINFLRIQLRKQNIDTRFQSVPDLPPVVANKTHVEEIFLNIFMNSIQAMPGGGTLHVSCAPLIREQANCVRVEVRDTGCGIDPDTLQRVFEPFFTTKEVGKGTGLGLYITHSLVQRCKGRIWLESIPGAGTKVTVLLPAAEDKQHNPEAFT